MIASPSKLLLFLAAAIPSRSAEILVVPNLRDSAPSAAAASPASMTASTAFNPAPLAAAAPALESASMVLAAAPAITADPAQPGAPLAAIAAQTEARRAPRWTV
jgi:hypothetical protein